VGFDIDDIEKHWDHTAHDDYDGVNAQTNSYLRRFEEGYHLMPLHDGAVVLDAGCGTGNGICYFSLRSKISGVGVDVSTAMLELAEAKIKRLGLPFQIFRQNIEEMTGYDDHFDAAFSFEVLEHTPNPRRYVEQVHRMLKKGGTAVFTTPNTRWEIVHWFVAVTGLHHSEGPHRFIPRAEIIEILTKAGFTVLKEKTTVLVPAGPRFLVSLGRRLEERLGERWMRHIGLRRLFLVQK